MHRHSIVWPHEYLSWLYRPENATSWKQQMVSSDDDLEQFWDCMEDNPQMRRSE